MPNPLEIFSTPQNVSQSILPGWIFGGVVNVTETNSSAPETEREVVAAHSYGRQLGRVLDALAVLIAERPKSKRDEGALDHLMELRREIDDIKSQAMVRRLDRIASDLATLKKSKPDEDEYDRVATKLREALSAS
jgi:hypothetical protein